VSQHISTTFLELDRPTTNTIEEKTNARLACIFYAIIIQPTAIGIKNATAKFQRIWTQQL
jgi:uncharacterized membrane protein